MTKAAHLWAIGYDDMVRAEQVRAEIARLGWDNGKAGKDIFLLDIATVVRHPDGSFTLNQVPFPGVANILVCTGFGFLVGLVMAAPLSGAALGALLGTTGTALAARVGISEDFIRDVEAMMKPGTSALFCLDEAFDIEAISSKIQGLGGTVLKTNVDLERAKLIQSTLRPADHGSATAGDNV